MAIPPVDSALVRIVRIVGTRSGPLRVVYDGGLDHVCLQLPRAAWAEEPCPPALPCCLSSRTVLGRLALQSVEALVDAQQRLAPADVETLRHVALRLVLVALRPMPVHRHASATSLSEK